MRRVKVFMSFALALATSLLTAAAVLADGFGSGHPH
jgi:hypothetical protein